MTQKGTQKRKSPRGGELAAGAKNGYGLAHLHVERQTGSQLGVHETPSYYVLSANVILKRLLTQAKECFRDTRALKDKLANIAYDAIVADRQAMTKSSYKGYSLS